MDDWTRYTETFSKFGLNKGINKGKAYKNHPVGNSPKLMPLDFSVFQDVILGLRNHIVCIEELDIHNRKINHWH